MNECVFVVVVVVVSLLNKLKIGLQAIANVPQWDNCLFVYNDTAPRFQEGSTDQLLSNMVPDAVSSNQITRYKLFVISKNSLEDYTPFMIGQDRLVSSGGQTEVVSPKKKTDESQNEVLYNVDDGNNDNKETV